MKKLCKSDDGMVCGVCAGIAKYFGIDPTIVRCLWLLAMFGCGVGLVAYLILAIIMPKED